MTMVREVDFTNLATERALLVGVKLKSERGGWAVEDSLAELGQLARTAGLEVGGQAFQKPSTDRAWVRRPSMSSWAPLSGRASGQTPRA